MDSIIKINSRPDPTPQSLINAVKIEENNQKIEDIKAHLITLTETVEQLTEMIKDIHLNSLKMHRYIKEKEDIKTEDLKTGWFY